MKKLGELQKRILEIYEDLEGVPGTNMGWLVFKKPEDFWEILGEARKEFPFDEMSYSDNMNCYKFRQWFVKWFGEEK